MEYHDYTPVLAVPYDMPISGYDTGNIARLRLWEAKSPIALDMKLFSSGEYLKALEKHAMAETISMVLYPEDNHREGQSLRLKQQYFLVSATLQDICAKHKAKYGTLANFAHKHVLHINDTHPTLVIPELMRILMDDNDMSWENAWNITSQSVAYTNHTVMPEALECWPVSLVQELMPRIMQIIHEINERFVGTCGTTSRTISRRSPGSPSCRTGSSAWRIWPSPARSRSTACPRCIQTSSRSACSRISTRSIRRSSATLPTALRTAAGCARPTRSWPR